MFREDCITYNDRLEVRVGCISESECTSCGWNLTGNACYDRRITHSVPDVFFVSLILAIGTFVLAVALRAFRTTGFFPSIVRGRYSLYNVVC